MTDNRARAERVVCPDCGIKYDAGANHKAFCSVESNRARAEREVEDELGWKIVIVNREDGEQACFKQVDDIKMLASYDEWKLWSLCVSLKEREIELQDALERLYNETTDLERRKNVMERPFILYVRELLERTANKGTTDAT